MVACWPARGTRGRQRPGPVGGSCAASLCRVRLADSSPVDGPPSSAPEGRNREGRTIKPAMWAGRASRDQRKPTCGCAAFRRFTCRRAEGENGPVDPAGVTAAAGAAGRPARPGGRPAASPGRAGGLGRADGRQDSGVGPVQVRRFLRVRSVRSCPLGWARSTSWATRSDRGSWPPRWRRRGGSACHGVAQAAGGGQEPAGLLQGVGEAVRPGWSGSGMGEGVGVL
jgi:hypothetical protein